MHRLKPITKLAGFLSAPRLPPKLPSSDCLHCRSLASPARTGRGRSAGRGNVGHSDGDIESSGNRKNDDGAEAFVKRFLQDDEKRSAQRASKVETGSVRRAGMGRSDSDEDEDEISSSAEEADTEDDFDEKERQAISNMDNEEFEKHLRHREQSKVAIPMDRRGGYVGKLQDDFAKNWRSHDDVARRLVPSEEQRLPKRRPEQPTMEKRANDYNIGKARSHAMLWQQEIRKLGGELESANIKDDMYTSSLNLAGKPSLPPHIGEGNYLDPNDPNYKAMPEDWEGSFKTNIDSSPDKEEAMMLREFDKRMEHNKRQIANFVKQHLYSRRRPVEGWNYVVESFDSETRRGKIGAYRYGATSDGKHGKPNELDKLTLKREALRSHQ